MDIKSKALLWVVGLFVVVSVGVTYYKTVILKDFQIVDTSSGEEDVVTDTAMVGDNSSVSDSGEAIVDSNDETATTSSDSVATSTVDTITQ
jgi:hypothetical protein